ELVVRGRGYLKSPRDIEDTVVRASNGTPVLVRNVARVVQAYTPRRGAVAPLALLMAFVGLKSAGVPANLLSMGAIDFGILLEGAVILVENAYRRLSIERPPPERVPHVVAAAAKEVVRPTLFSMAIIGAAMMPVFTLERVEGRIFQPVALTYAFALGGALLFTLTTVPALTAALLKHRPVGEKHPAFLDWLQARYRWGLGVAMRRPLRTALVAAGVVLAAMALVPRLGSEFLPPMNEGDIHITVTMPSAISLERGAEVLRETRLVLLRFPEIKDVLTEQGHPEDGTDDEAANQSETFVIVRPESEWRTGRTKQQLVAAMREALERRPGVEFNFSQPIKDRVEESISGIRGQVVIKIYGEDLALMQKQLEAVAAILGSVRGALDVGIYRAGSAQHLVADIDRQAASRHGVTVREIEDAIESGLGGQLATWMWEGERRVGVRVKLTSEGTGAGKQAVGRLEVPVGQARLALSSLARLHVDGGRTQINREHGQRFLALKCNIEGRDMGSFVEEGQARVAAGVKLPEGYHLTWGGEFENQRRAMRRLGVIVPISVLVIFLLLYATFRAALPALVVLLDVPFATVGGVFALYLTGTELSVSSAVGFITLFGVSVMNGVLIVTYMRQAKGAPGATAGSVLAAVAGRIRPILMTALPASIGLLPAALSHSIGSDTQRPFAIVIVGGLLPATLLTMFLLPTMYELMDRWFGSGWRARHPEPAEEP
ncbi:MAG TPA: efflux RND transporter permease subunit, partial [Polyangia bacterium]|nr:efflux RND transporter permease subunit [Polyangia bacterium]